MKGVIKKKEREICIYKRNIFDPSVIFIPYIMF